MLDGHTDEVAALRRHHIRLLTDAERLHRLADTVARTIEEREGGTPMAAEELFDGFANDPYGQEARERWGETAVESQRRAASWDPGTAARIKARGDAVNVKLAAAMRAGTPVDDPTVQEAVAEHHAWVGNFWTPNREAYIGLGDLYVDDPRFSANIDRAGPGLAAYLRDAMTVYAQTELR
ncbi:TipAS antibiotic-recognition domain-containing protein [Pseudonocardia bannensis]|uniref:TipAS antibiotic-recognition domain-containing protein n=1 Tax=Pseudonocardia bannensis TaxID=630973 RepID=A0A848DEG4_9PSEU|nr:TipAS antibiotic-recognition domain-containing protein [Pseudonocardia bannensis]NMH90974.1 hypothetical protein [Pseudonocardia bannensis]